jgi:hypothetical protein
MMYLFLFAGTSAFTSEPTTVKIGEGVFMPRVNLGTCWSVSFAFDITNLVNSPCCW